MTSETSKWLARIVPGDSDKHVMLAVWDLVNCIAFVPVAGLTAKAQKGKRA